MQSIHESLRVHSEEITAIYFDFCSRVSWTIEDGEDVQSILKFIEDISHKTSEEAVSNFMESCGNDFLKNELVVASELELYVQNIEEGEEPVPEWY